jgi:uncharacterized FAD-dependent dehydrogenase
MNMANRCTKMTLVCYSKVLEPPMEHKRTCLGMVRNGYGIAHLEESMKNMAMMTNKDFLTRLVFKTKVRNKINFGKSTRKLDFPIGNGDELEKMQNVLDTC